MKNTQTSIENKSRKVVKNRNAGASGFSLIELLVVSVIFGIIFVTITRVLLTAVKSDARLTEQSESATRGGVITDVLQNDFSNPLRFFSGSPISLSGTFPVSYAPHADYELSPGFASRIASTSPAPLVSTLILPSGQGTARFSISGSAGATFGWHTVGSGQTADFSTLRVMPVSGNSRQFTILSPSGEQQSGSTAASPRFGYRPDGYEVRVEQLPAPTGCRIAFYVVNQLRTELLARSAGNCPPMPLEIVADITGSSGALNSQMFGSFVPRPGSQRIPPLPCVGNIQITTPIFINPENNDLVLFRAEGSTDKTFSTVSNYFDASAPSTVTIKPPTRGTYKAGDYIFVADYAGSHSVVAVVGSAQAVGAELQLSVTPISTSSAGAWGFFYSRPEDFTSVEFPPGSQIIHLAAPVSYRYLPTDKMIVRREGGGLWETVAPGVNSFNVTLTATALDIVVEANTEGVETSNSAPAQRTHLSIPIE